MLRRKIDNVLKSWNEGKSKALLITGARQVGKTYSIKEFIKANFEYRVEINFAERSDLIDSFAQIKNPEELIVLLSIVNGGSLVEGKTVIFFDEIQLLYTKREELKKAGKLDSASQDILTAMKPLVIDGRYKYILSGSLLGVTLRDIILRPAGYMDVHKMYPLDFEEFLWAKKVGDKAIDHIKGCYEAKTPVEESIHRLFLDLFNQYVLIGGMPEAVSEYLSSNNLHRVQSAHEQIISVYGADISAYAPDDREKLRLREIYRAIPSELNSKNKRFVSSHVIDKNYLKRNDILDEYIWLTSAGIAIPVYNVSEPTIPLTLSSERKTLKLFLNDIGLLGASLFTEESRLKLLRGEIEVNYGAPYENAVAQELWAHGFNEHLFYYNSKKSGEVDFLLERADGVLPIEIKSGKPNDLDIYNHRALNNLLEKYPLEKAYVFGKSNVEKENEKIINFPIYMVGFLTPKI